MTARLSNLGLLAATTLALRLPFLVLSQGAPFDMESYARVAACPGPGLYAAPWLAGRYPYLPLWWVVLKALALARWALGGLGAWNLWFRLPGLAGDVGVCAFAYLLAEGRRRGSGSRYDGFRRGEDAALAAGLAWALNPLAWLISAGHGQFDSLVLALVLGAAWSLEYSGHPRGESRAALCLGLAIALKTWPLALLPCFLGVFPAPRDRARFAAKALALPVLLPLAWLFSDGPAAVFGRLCYGGANALGLSGALKACFFAFAVSPGLWRETDFVFRCLACVGLAAAFAWALARPRRLRLTACLPWAGLTLVLLAPGLSPQYLLWAPALALAVSPRLCWRLTLGALPLALGFYALFMPAVLAGSSAWAAPRQGEFLVLCWAAANLAWWLWTAREWWGLRARNLRPLRPGNLF